ncbi:MAG: hypothetical protein FVQ82_10975 [Planctomycetes bacterium]|nr:hypothetical protein [Planctomycetota bacterium]
MNTKIRIKLLLTIAVVTMALMAVPVSAVDVISQNPIADTEVANGCNISLVVSSGPFPVSELAIAGVYLAQTHVLEPDDSLFKLVGNRDALLKVQVVAPPGTAVPLRSRCVHSSSCRFRGGLTISDDGGLEEVDEFFDSLATLSVSLATCSASSAFFLTNVSLISTSSATCFSSFAMRRI